MELGLGAEPDMDSYNHPLELKSKLEEQEEIAYGNARMRFTEEENKLNQLKEQKLGYEGQYRELISNQLNVNMIRSVQAAIEMMKRKIKQQIIVVESAEKSLEIARERLNKAMVERKTYERLKEKAFDQFKIEVDQAEQKEIDELVSYKFNCHTT